MTKDSPNSADRRVQGLKAQTIMVKIMLKYCNELFQYVIFWGRYSITYNGRRSHLKNFLLKVHYLFITSIVSLLICRRVDGGLIVYYTSLYITAVPCCTMTYYTVYFLLLVAYYQFALKKLYEWINHIKMAHGLFPCMYSIFSIKIVVLICFYTLSKISYFYKCQS